MSKQPNQPVQAIKISARDWRAIPPHIKYVVGGINRILTQGRFVEVQILH